VNPIELPALNGRDPLGFLAAVGLTRLLNDDERDARLSFSTETGNAVIHGRHGTTAALAARLREIVATIPPGGVLPGSHPDFPLAKTGTGSDPMRVARGEYRFALAAPLLADRADIAHTWLHALVTDLDEDNNKRAAITPYTAPSGQQSIRSFFEKPLSLLRNHPQHIEEAIAGWRRVDGYTGEYLDHRVLRSAADHPSGQSVEAGVPGATWLAEMALPLLRLTADKHGAIATGWHRAAQGRGRRMTLVWPLWTPPLDCDAIQVLLEHPCLRPSKDAPVTIDMTPLRALGVFMVCAAQRQPIEGRKNAGVLVPIDVSIDTGDRRGSADRPSAKARPDTEKPQPPG
jgi:hypothetical protein